MSKVNTVLKLALKTLCIHSRAPVPSDIILFEEWHYTQIKYFVKCLDKYLDDFT